MPRNNNALPPSDPVHQKVAIYVRVSTAMQADRDSLPMQRQDLESYSRLILGIDDFVFFEDAGYSAKNTDRPAFQKMMSRVRKGEFTHILVWKIDRISRNLLDFAQMYQELQKLRVTFVSKNEQFDTSTAIGEAMLKIILVFAELERNMTSERVSATMISRANNGIWNGGKVPFGYSYDPESGCFSIREDEAHICREMKDDYISSHSLTGVSKRMNAKGYRQRTGNEWSPTTVWIMLSSPFYAGIYRYNRYKGTQPRVENPSDEWVMVYDHHPAIYSVEEYELMCRIRESNRRSRNSIGKQNSCSNVYVFSGLLRCGLCGNRMSVSPGRLQVDGYRTSIYHCPLQRRSHECSNPSVSDLSVGEFVINYILNILNAKKSFSELSSPSALESRLLFGNTFSDIDYIEPEGVNELFNLLSRYGSDDSYVFASRRPRKKQAEVDPEMEALRKEKEKQERALRRLQDLYLYSPDAMTEKDYIVRKSEISSRLDDANRQIGMLAGSSSPTLSDEDFIRQASHLLIAKELESKTYIYYKNLASNTSPDVLKSYMETIIDSIWVANSRVSAIAFKNGMRHNFIYKKQADKD